MRRLLLPIALLLALTAAPAWAAVPYDGVSGATFYGTGLTAVGLPQIGAGGTVGAGELSSHLMTYHDSGLYDRDLEDVADDASTYLADRLARKRQCKVRYRHVRGRLFKRVRKCTRPKIDGKPAIVLDIDETSLSNYGGLASSGFTAGGVALAALAGNSPAVAPTLDLYKQAKDAGVAVFFITGRPDAIRALTESNLRSAGYTDFDGLTFKPSGTTTAEYKAAERARLEDEGYDVLVNMGDQESDLNGGHADRAFKLPNPFYFIADR